MTYQKLDTVHRSINQQIDDMENELEKFRMQTLHIINLSSVANSGKAKTSALDESYEIITRLQSGTNKLEYFMVFL